MTYSPDDPQQQPPEEQPVVPASSRFSLDSDEWIAILVAFGVIGTLFFWSIRPQVAGRGAGGWLTGNSAGLVGNADADSSGNVGLGSLIGAGAENSGDADGMSVAAAGDTSSSPSARLSDDETEEDEPPTVNLFRRPSTAAAVAGGAIAASSLPASASAPDDGTEAAPLAVDSSTEPEAAPDAAAETAVPAETAGEPAPVEAADSPEPAASTPVAEAPPVEAPPVEAPPVEAPLEVASEALDTSVPEISEESWVAPFAASLTEANRFGALPTPNGENAAAGFDIDAPVTRAEFAALINEAEQAQGTADAAASQFDDIEATFWAAEGIAGASSAGFMSGYSKAGGKLAFEPGQQIPRWQVFVTLASGLGLEAPADVDAVLSKYDTTGIPDWARGQVAATLNEGLVINPDTSKGLEATRPATRGEATAMLQQVLQREEKVNSVDATGVTIKVGE